MLRDLIQLLPRDAGSATAALATLGAVAGLVLWLSGARFSRPMMTLVATALGAVVGSALPTWFGWGISPMGPAVGLALILGVTGFVLHRMWVGLGLGLVLAIWSTLACWLVLRGNQAFDWPSPEKYTTLLSWLRAAWHELPSEPATVIPYGAAVAAVSGLAMTILWPRFSTLLAWNLIGVSLLVGMATAAVNYSQPQWMKAIPEQTWSQCLTLGLMVVLGLLIQWRTGALPADGPKKGGKSKTDKPREGAD